MGLNSCQCHTGEILICYTEYILSYMSTNGVFWGQNNPYGFVFSSGSSPGGDLNVELIQITDMYNRI